MRIDIPEGKPKTAWVAYEIGSPALNARLRQSWDTQYVNDSTLTPREREAARMRTAHILGCSVCQGFRMAEMIPGFSPEGIEEDLYTHVLEYRTWPGYSTRERFVIEFSERYMIDFEGLKNDEPFWAALKEHFTNTEICDLCLLCNTWEGLMKSYHLLVGVPDVCELRPSGEYQIAGHKTA